MTDNREIQYYIAVRRKPKAETLPLYRIPAARDLGSAAAGIA